MMKPPIRPRLGSVMSYVGPVIKRLREERELSQTQLAALVGTGPSAISEIEHGKRNPNAVTLMKLAEALGVEVGELFPKAQGPLQLEFEEQAGRNSQQLNEPGEDPAERRDRDEYAEALIAKWIEEGEHLEEEIKSSPDGFPLGRTFLFNLACALAETLYKEIESTRQPPKALQEVKETLDTQSTRIGKLWGQTMHPENGEMLAEFNKFAKRRAAVRDSEGGVKLIDNTDLHSKDAG
jgi:transcriptional regulator with XRE-family HTH domain